MAGKARDSNSSAPEDDNNDDPPSPEGAGVGGPGHLHPEGAGPEVEGANEAEDDAPESAQGQGPWSTFPDLLRVEGSTTNGSGPTASNNSVGDDDPPEGQGRDISPLFRLASRHASAAMSSTNPSPHMVPRVSVAPTARRTIETGAIPKRTGNSPMNTQPDLTSSRNVVSVPASTFSIDKPMVRASSSSPSNGHPSGSVPQPSIGLGPPNISIQGQLATITSSVEALSRSFQTFSENVSRQLNQLDTRINSLASTQGKQQSSSNQPTAPIDQLSVESIRGLIREQREELSRERTSFMISLSDAFRAAATGCASNSVNNLDNPSGTSNNHDTNGPS